MTKNHEHFSNVLDNSYASQFCRRTPLSTASSRIQFKIPARCLLIEHLCKFRIGSILFLFYSPSSPSLQLSGRFRFWGCSLPRIRILSTKGSKHSLDFGRLLRHPANQHAFPQSDACEGNRRALSWSDHWTGKSCMSCSSNLNPWTFQSEQSYVASKLYKRWRVSRCSIYRNCISGLRRVWPSNSGIDPNNAGCCRTTQLRNSHLRSVRSDRW